PRLALFGFPRPTLMAQQRSAVARSASANWSGTKWVASGMVTSAEPKPVMPKISAPANAMAASSAASRPMDQERLWRAAVHRAELRDVARERQLVARFELLRARAQCGPGNARRRAAESKGEDVGVV